MLSSLQNLLDQRQLWRARESGDPGAHALATGWPRLDRELYGAGWPIASLSELFCVEPVLAWQLLQPTLVQLSQQQRLLVWIGHEHAPYAPAWLQTGLQLPRCLLVRAGEDEAPWAAEQALRLAQGGAVILQADKLSPDRLRRLQLAAQSGNSFGFLLRPQAAQRHTSPAVLRLMVQAADNGLQLTVLKRRGGTVTTAFVVPVRSTGSVKSALSVLPTEPEHSVGVAKPQLPMNSSVSVAFVAPTMPVKSIAPVASVLRATAAMPNGVSKPHRPLVAVATEMPTAAVQAAVANESAPLAQQRDQRSSVTLPPRMAASFLTEPLLNDKALTHGEVTLTRVNQCNRQAPDDSHRQDSMMVSHTLALQPEPLKFESVKLESLPQQSVREPAVQKLVAGRAHSENSRSRQAVQQPFIPHQLDLIRSSQAQANQAQANQAQASQSKMGQTKTSQSQRNQSKANRLQINQPQISTESSRPIKAAGKAVVVPDDVCATEPAR